MRGVAEELLRRGQRSVGQVSQRRAVGGERPAVSNAVSVRHSERSEHGSARVGAHQVAGAHEVGG
jgi:hypothetical protein